MKNLFTLFIIIFNIVLHNPYAAQSNNIYTVDNEIHASPEVTNFHINSFANANQYTGGFDFNIPIYEINIGNIKVPISIDYISGGVKVSSEASNVGTGWALNAGGSIFRKIRDLDDKELMYYSLGLDPIRSPSPLEEFVPSETFPTQRIMAIGYHRRDNINFSHEYFKGKVDSSPDEYCIKAPGLNDSFILNHKEGDDFNLYEGVFLNNTLNKLSPVSRSGMYDQEYVPYFFSHDEDGNPQKNYGSKHFDEREHYFYQDFQFFHVYNQQGLKYTFGKPEVFESYSIPIIADYDAAADSPRITSYNRSISAWNLRAIEDPTSNRKVEFHYFPRSQSVASCENNYSHQADLDFDNYSEDFDYCFYQHIPFTGLGVMDSKHLTRVKVPRKHDISLISWDMGTVEFKYNDFRMDTYSTSKQLNEIIVKNLWGDIVKHFKLEYSYFNSSDPCGQPECLRLRLDRVVELSNEGMVVRGTEFEYYYDNPLPNKNSLEVDYLGYYNGNLAGEYNFNGQWHAPPQLYFYPGQGKYSFLPFPKNNNSSGRALFDEQYSYDLQANELSKSGALKKVNFANGGFMELFYENHDFLFEGADYAAGGVRLKKQVISDGSGLPPMVKEYEYDLENGMSSGTIASFPVFAYPNTCNIDMSASQSVWDAYFTTFDKPKSNLQLKNSSFVGYSRVVEFSSGLGSTELLFSNHISDGDIEPTFSETHYLLENSAFGQKNHVSKEKSRGNLLQKKVWDENGQLVLEVQNTYSNDVLLSLDLSSKIRLEQNFPNVVGCPDMICFKNIYSSSTLNIERDVLVNSKKKELYANQNYEENTSVEYDSFFPLKSSEWMQNSDGSEIRKEYGYAMNIPSNPLVQDNLESQNRLSELVKVNRFKDNYPLSSSWVSYLNYDVGEGEVLSLPFLERVSKATEAYEEIFKVTKRDEFGNPIEQIQKDGLKTYNVWGYNGGLLVATIYNLENTDSPDFINLVQSIQLFSSSDNYDFDNLNQSLHYLQSFVSENNSQMETYSYKPLIGVISKSNVRGITTNYTFDSFNRLKYVSDEEGNVLKEINYNYKNY